MPDEPKVTDQDLNDAAEAVIQEPVPIEPPPAPAQEEPSSQVPTAQPPSDQDENIERTRLGRRVKRIEDDMTNFMTEMRGYMSVQRQTPPALDEPLSDDMQPITKKETLQVIQEYESKKNQENIQYFKDYVRHLTTAGLELSEDEYNEVVKEHQDKFNIRHSSDAKADAERNFLNAYNSVLKKRISKVSKERPNPLPGKKPEAPLGGPPGAPPADTRPTVKSKLDADATHFAQALGLSEEWVNDALIGEAPLYLAKK